MEKEAVIAQTIQNISDYIKDQDFHAEYNEEKRYFRLPRCGVSGCKMQHFTMHISVDDRGVSFTGIVPIGVDVDNRNVVSEFIVRTNYHLRQGRFNMDYRDGQVDFSLYRDFKDGPLSADVIDDKVSTMYGTLRFYGDALLKVIFNMQTPEEAVAEARNK